MGRRERPAARGLATRRSPRVATGGVWWEDHLTKDQKKPYPLVDPQVWGTNPLSSPWRRGGPETDGTPCLRGLKFCRLRPEKHFDSITRHTEDTVCKDRSALLETPSPPTKEHPAPPYTQRTFDLFQRGGGFEQTFSHFKTFSRGSLGGRNRPPPPYSSTPLSHGNPNGGRLRDFSPFLSGSPGRSPNRREWINITLNLRPHPTTPRA